MLRRLGIGLLSCALALPAVAQESQGEKAKLAELEARLRKLEAELAEAKAKTGTGAAERIKERIAASSADAQKRAEEAKKRAAEAMKHAEAVAKEHQIQWRKIAEAQGHGKKETYIGLMTGQVPPALAAHLSGFKKGQGLIVESILPDSPAAKAGVKEFDILMTCNDASLASPEQFKKLVVGMKSGQKVTLGVVRAGDKLRIDVTLAEREGGMLGGLYKLDAGGKPFVFDGSGFGKEWKVAEPFKGEFKVFAGPGEEGMKIFKATPGAKGTKVESANTVRVEIRDGKVTVHADCKGKDGKTESKSISGSLEEVKAKVGEMPEAVRDAVKKALQNATVGEGGQIKIEMKVGGDKAEGGKPTTGKRVKVMHVGPGDVTDLAEVGADKMAIGLHVKDLADLKDLADIQVKIDAELKDLPAEVRDQVHKSLKDIKVNMKGVNVEPGKKRIIIQHKDSQ